MHKPRVYFITYEPFEDSIFIGGTVNIKSLMALAQDANWKKVRVVHYLECETAKEMNGLLARIYRALASSRMLEEDLWFRMTREEVDELETKYSTQKIIK